MLKINKKVQEKLGSVNFGSQEHLNWENVIIVNLLASSPTEDPSLSA